MIKNLLKITLLLCILFSAKSIKAQDDSDQLFKYGNHGVNKGEFLYGFNKNRDVSNIPSTAEIDTYLNLYAKYKLKVQDALDMRKDTSPSFANELGRYRVQVAKSYLSDKTVMESLNKEAYERFTQDVHVSHFMVSSAASNPTDTLRAFQLISKHRDNIVNKGIDFNVEAQNHSGDPSAKENKGDLGWFTAFYVVYPFESMAYNTAVGGVSPVFKTRFGYHILKVHDKKKSDGEIQTSHIFLRLNPKPTSKELTEVSTKAKAIVAELNKGADFKGMVQKFSEDFATKNRGGDAGWFRTSTHSKSKEYKKAAFGINAIGEYADLLKTDKGFYIIKLNGKRKLQKYDDLKNWIKQKVSRDSRSQVASEAFYKRIKEENNFKANSTNLDAFIASVSESEINNGNIQVSKYANNTSTLFSLKDQNYTGANFASYIQKLRVKSLDKKDYVLRNVFKQYVNESVTIYEDKNLENKYPEFKYLMQEYKEGILLFDLMAEKVWQKANSDTLGQQRIYSKNKDNYQWKPRFEAWIYNARSKEILTLVEKDLKSGLSNDSILRKFNAKNPLNLMVKNGKFQEGDNSTIDPLFKNESLKTKKNYFYAPTSNKSDEHILIKIVNFKKTEAKTLNDAKGEIISEYQKELEDNWVKDIKQKYPITVDQDEYKEMVLNEIMNSWKLKYPEGSNKECRKYRKNVKNELKTQCSNGLLYF